jgi:hypothetical protein
MSRLTRPVLLEWFPEGACTRPSSIRGEAIAAALLLDFILLRKSGSVLPRSRESPDPLQARPPLARLRGGERDPAAIFI